MNNLIKLPNKKIEQRYTLKNSVANGADRRETTTTADPTSTTTITTTHIFKN